MLLQRRAKTATRVFAIVILFGAAWNGWGLADGTDPVIDAAEKSALQPLNLADFPPVPENPVDVSLFDIPGSTRLGVVGVVETVPVRHGGDAADDVAVWVDSVDPLNSVIIGTDKRGGLGVYGLDGRELHYYDVGRMNNVDLRQGFVLGGESVAIVAASDRDRDAIHLYSVDPVTRGLIPIGPAPIETSLGLAGLCMYHSGVSGAFSVFVTDSQVVSV